MKFILLAAMIAVAYSAAAATHTSVTLGTTYNTGTKLNATCGVSISAVITLAGLTASKTEKFGLWLTTSTTVTPAALTDWEIYCAWTATSDASTATAVAASTTTTATCTLYAAASTSAWATSGTSLTTSGSSVTATGTFATTAAVSFDAWNTTTSNFTATSKTLYAWGALAEDTATLATTGAAYSTATTTLTYTTCNTGMSAIKSGAIANQFLSAFLTLCFF